MIPCSDFHFSLAFCNFKGVSIDLYNPILGSSGFGKTKSYKEYAFGANPDEFNFLTIELPFKCSNAIVSSCNLLIGHFVIFKYGI